MKRFVTALIVLPTLFAANLSAQGLEPIYVTIDLSGLPDTVEGTLRARDIYGPFAVELTGALAGSFPAWGFVEQPGDDQFPRLKMRFYQSADGQFADEIYVELTLTKSNIESYSVCRFALFGPSAQDSGSFEDVRYEPDRLADEIAVRFERGLLREKDKCFGKIKKVPCARRLLSFKAPNKAILPMPWEKFGAVAPRSEFEMVFEVTEGFVTIWSEGFHTPAEHAPDGTFVSTLHVQWKPAGETEKRPVKKQDVSNDTYEDTSMFLQGKIYLNRIGPELSGSGLVSRHN